MMTSRLPARSKDWAAPGRAGWWWVAPWRLRALLWGMLLPSEASAAAALTAKVTANQPQLQEISVVCDFDAPRFEAAGGFTRITVTGCENLGRVGEPLLPFRTLRVLLPPASEVAGVDAQPEVTPEVISGEWRVEFGRTPVRTPRPGEPTKAQVPSDEPDPRIYLSDAPFPSTAVELASVQRMGGYDIAIIRAYPIQYSPLSGKLTFAPRLRISVSLASRGGAVSPPLRAYDQNRARRSVAAMVDNAEMLTAYGGAKSLDPPKVAVFDYLLITKSNLVAAFKPLADRKVLDGLAVKVETVESIIASQTGRDQPEKIRNYIRYAYTNWGITYVLLGGDSSVVPVRYAYAYMAQLEGGDYPRNLPACDLYFGCLDGSWDHDGDNIFGEPTDGETGGEVDLLAEVYVGRAPVDTVAEVNVFVEKTIRYEAQPHGRVSNALFVAGYLNVGNAQGRDILQPATNSFAPYQVSWLDDAPYTTSQWSFLDAIAALNQSPHIALYAGHSYTAEDIMHGMIAEDLDAVTNSWPFLLCSVSCLAGAFDNDNFLNPFDSIGEDLVKRNSRAAFAAILNSREGWFDQTNEWKFSGEFQAKFFDQLLDNKNTRLGVAMQLGKHAMIGRVETNGLMIYRFCYFEINLFGDPHVALQTPPELIVSSALGGASPPVGTNSYSSGSLVTCAVTNSPLSAGVGRQYVCTGWSGTGSVPASGTATQVTLTLTTNSQIAWSWKTQVWFAASASGNGSLSAPNGWRDAGTALTVQAAPSNYYHFVGWTGDVPAGMESNPTLNLTMNQPLTLVAAFAENLTASGTPEWWLASYGWTNQFEAASLADADQDGMPAWAEYIAGTSPVDGASDLRIALSIESGPELGRVLRWPSVANRFYSVYRATSPDGVFARLTNGVPATPPLNTFIDLESGSAGFYRVGVTNSP